MSPVTVVASSPWVIQPTPAVPVASQLAAAAPSQPVVAAPPQAGEEAVAAPLTQAVAASADAAPVVLQVAAAPNANLLLQGYQQQLADRRALDKAQRELESALMSAGLDPRAVRQASRRSRGSRRR